MTVTIGEGGKPVFSDDHQYTSIIWAISDGADVPFSAFFDMKRVFKIKLDQMGYARLRTMAALFIQPYRRAVYLEKINRTLHWASSTLETSDVLTRALNIGITMMHKELAPNHQKWEPLFEQQGDAAFASLAELHANFPELLQEEGRRVASFIQDHAEGLQEGKRLNTCSRGDGWHSFGSGALYTIIGPLLSAAIAELTGAWPERELKPGDGFRLVFKGSELIQAVPLWIDLSLSEEAIPLNFELIR